MGKGKGNKLIWLCPIKKGTIIYKMSGFQSFLYLYKNKLPEKCKIVKINNI